MNDITEVDRLNAKIADLKRTIEWLQGRIGITMGEAAQAEIAGAPAPLPVELQLIYPPAMTPLLAHVLGFPNFRTGPIAHVFQKAGFAIPTKCEAEQAFVLDRMIRAVLTHGEGWAAAFEDDLRAQFAIIEERKVAATPSEHAEKPK